ncbi:MAG TPA: BtrH N-terminal domain-containing protein [Fimbriimonadaceae bacterium]|nr:BtrH N-terminal domain-containing protein [Fimbriimonadaceae bacterium]
MTSGFVGKHYETGTIANALAAIGARDPQTGKPYSEALAFGASGGIAFGNFVFEYKGCLPHIAILTRNTFSPFERALDNLAIRRDQRETTDAARAEKNLREELDMGNPVLVWADMFSFAYTGLNGDQMWIMRPYLVVGHEGSDFLVVDGRGEAFPISAEDLAQARGKVKKDRFRIMVLEAPEAERLPPGLLEGLKTCVALFLDKPPAGSPNNFGICGMRHWAKRLSDPKDPKSWARKFEPGPNFVQALAGSYGQPGVWDWISGFGSPGRANRDMFADFLEEAAAWTGLKDLAEPVRMFRRSAQIWDDLAEASMPDSIPEFKALKELKRRHGSLWVERGLDSLAERADIRAEMRRVTEAAAASIALRDAAPAICGRMAELILAVAEIEEPAIHSIRSIADELEL